MFENIKEVQAFIDFWYGDMMIRNDITASGALILCFGSKGNGEIKDEQTEMEYFAEEHPDLVLVDDISKKGSRGCIVVRMARYGRDY